MEKSDNLVGGLLERLNISPIALDINDPSLIFAIKSGKYLINVFHDADREVVVFFACVHVVPEDMVTKAIDLAMAANFLDTENDGFWWAWNAEQKALVLQYWEDERLMDERDFQRILTAIGLDADRLHDKLYAVDAPAPSGDQDPRLGSLV